MAVGYPLSRKHILTHQEPLRFSADGKFKILHLPDIHKIHPDMDDREDRSIPQHKTENTLNTIKCCIEKSNPDLVVFGGDNISGHWIQYKNEYLIDSMKAITEEVIKRNIPLAIVFGNHDGQHEDVCELLSREIQMTLYMDYDNFRGTYNEADVFGCGNCHLPILANNSDDVVWNVWCVDSNDYPRYDNYERAGKGYDFVHEDQLEWYKSVVKAETKKYGRIIPSVWFQHMPVNQELDYIEECDESECEFRTKNGFFKTKKGAIVEGAIEEHPCPPRTGSPMDRAEFEAWKECGDVKAAFFGHDHKNHFRIVRDGISLYQTIATGYETYGGDKHGGRLITLYDDGKTIETETIIVPPLYDVPLD